MAYRDGHQQPTELPVNALGKLFLQGLAVAIPVALTLAIIFWLGAGAERMLGSLLLRLLPEGWYLPGMGLLSTLALILLTGLLTHVIVFQRLLAWSESILNRLPLVKTIYSALKDFTDYFSADAHDNSKVVLVQLPGQEFQLLGFVTREQFDDLPLQPAAEQAVAVYLPMSYQIGGYTLYLPASTLTPLDISFEDGMRLAITGGVSRSS